MNKPQVINVRRGHKSPFSPYDNGYAYCPLCGRFYPITDVPKAVNGLPLCPYHRMFLRLRGVKG
ncbi:MAG: hypothetical protein QXL98_03630 [Thermofilaceae archaeon]